MKFKSLLTLLIISFFFTMSMQEEVFARSVPKAVIAVDPGHGGIDWGATVKGVKEKNINLSIGLKLRKYLDSNYSVIMTRKDDINLANFCKDRRVKSSAKALYQRCTIFKRSAADLFISLHVDSCTNRPWESGSVVYYNAKMPKSKDLALSIQKQLNSIVVNGKKRAFREIKTGDYYLLENNSIPGVIIETGYLTNSTERNNLVKDSFQEAIAKAIYTGINNYIGK